MQDELTKGWWGKKARKEKNWDFGRKRPKLGLTDGPQVGSVPEGERRAIHGGDAT